MLSVKPSSPNARVESPQFDLASSEGHPYFHKLFLDVYKHSFELFQKRSAKYLPIMQAFIEHYRSCIARNKSIAHQGQIVAKWKYQEIFKQFGVIFGALKSMSRVLLELQNNAWVADANKAGHLIKT